MMDFIMVPLVVGICVLGTYKLFELFARRRERLALIEKMEILSDSEKKLQLPEYSNFNLSFNALKTGCLLIGIGLGLLIGYMICCISIPDYIQIEKAWQVREISSLIYGASVLLFGGAGLIVAFIIELKISKKKKD